jgi:hypothetical protein
VARGIVARKTMEVKDTYPKMEEKKICISTLLVMTTPLFLHT